VQSTVLEEMKRGIAIEEILGEQEKYVHLVDQTKVVAT
jgi:hypothetical protein